MKCFAIFSQCDVVFNFYNIVVNIETLNYIYGIIVNLLFVIIYLILFLLLYLFGRSESSVGEINSHLKILLVSYYALGI